MHIPTPFHPPMRVVAPLALLACALLGFSGLDLASAEDEPAPQEPARLEKHPLADAKPGEFLRYVETSGGGWKKWFIERVLDVREGEILFEVFQTDEEGTKDHGAVFKNGWIKIPEFKAGEYQRFIKDEMVVLEVNEQKLSCRYLFIEEPLEPPFPEPKVRREVWYSNDIPCSGKVKESRNNREVIGWGMMPPEEIQRRKAPYEKREPPKEGEGEGS